MEMGLLGGWKVLCAIGNNNFEGNDGLIAARSACKTIHC